MAADEIMAIQWLSVSRSEYKVEILIPDSCLEPFGGLPAPMCSEGLDDCWSQFDFAPALGGFGLVKAPFALVSCKASAYFDGAVVKSSGPSIAVPGSSPGLIPDVTARRKRACHLFLLCRIEELRPPRPWT